MTSSTDHPLRYALVNELHARPFPVLDVPSQAVYVAIKEPTNAAGRDRAADLAHLTALLDRHAAPHPQPGATHYTHALGKHVLKWESHTEFVTYSAFSSGLSERPYDPHAASVFTPGWIEAAPGKRIAALLIRIEVMPEDPAAIDARIDDWFVGESLTCSIVVDGAAVIATDFQIDPAGFMRFAVFVRPGTGSRRVGRIVQRLCEIETYRAMSMLGLGRVRELGVRLNVIDPKLSDLVSAMSDDASRAETALHELLVISAELESLAVQMSFRFGATAAYEAIVNQRIEVLRETRFQGRQTFGEFMMRRYDPAMRTVKSAESRLGQLAARAQRAAELLRTRVDVERSAQNQRLLESMDRRADLALRLQHTVEGLSVVAISYYAFQLLRYVVQPVAEGIWHLPEPVVEAALVPVVVLTVWALLRRLRRHID